MKRSISFAEGFLGTRRDDGVMYTYSPSKAKRLTKQEIDTRKDLVEVRVGLDGDWNCNNDVLWDNIDGWHKPEFYTQSCWAKPSLLFIYADGSEKDGGDCYVISIQDFKENPSKCYEVSNEVVVKEQALKDVSGKD